MSKVEEQTIIEILKHFVPILSAPACFVDVGSNSAAIMAAPFIDLNWRTVLIEPQALCYSDLRARYGARDNVSIFNMGCSDEPGELRLFHGKDGARSEVATFYTSNDPWMSAVRNDDSYEAVAVDRLSSILDQAGISEIGILKVDTEGFDSRVLAGLDFERRRPSIIVTEEYLWAIDETTRKHDLLYANGYLLFGYVGYNSIWVRNGLGGLSPSLLTLNALIPEASRHPITSALRRVHGLDTLLRRSPVSNTFSLGDATLLIAGIVLHRSEDRMLRGKLSLSNVGTTTMPCLPRDGRQLFLSYHLVDETTGKIHLWDGPRYALQSDIGPGETCLVDFAVEDLPKRKLILVPDVVDEGRSWYSHVGKQRPQAIHLSRT